MLIIKFRGRGDEFFKVIILMALEEAGLQLRGLEHGDVCVLQFFGSCTVFMLWRRKRFEV